MEKKYKHDGKIRQDKAWFATNILHLLQEYSKKRFCRPRSDNWSIGKEKQAIQKWSKFIKMMKSFSKYFKKIKKTFYNVSQSL